MFDKEFYPTPYELVAEMAKKISWRHETHVLEPSAGKGDIVIGVREYLKGIYGNYSPNWNVIEQQEELRSILFSKGLSVVGRDFLTFNTADEYDVIMANPPFSNGAEHLIKMIELAENQSYKDCQIVCLLNAETLNNTFSHNRTHLATLLEKYQAEVTFYDKAFKEAERQTNVAIAMVNVTVKHKDRDYSFIDEIISNCKTTDEKAYDLTIATAEVGYSEEEIKRLISAYQEHVKRYKAFFKAYRDLEVYNNYLYKKENIQNHTLRNSRLNYDDELNHIRYNYWDKILNTEKFRKHLTRDAYSDLQQKIYDLTCLDITLENVYAMLLTLVQNQSEMLYNTLEGLFDKLTARHQESFSKNIHYYNGWKTNSAYKLNKKVIIPLSYGEAGSRFRSWERDSWDDVDFSVKERIEDIIKVMHLVSPTEEGDWQQLGDYEFENNLLRFKVFKKNTMHIWFKDLVALDKMNFLVGQHKQWLPSEDEIKTNKEAEQYVKKEFPNMRQKQLKG